MQVSLCKIHSASDLEAVKSIYIESFPVEERRPWSSLLNAVDDGRIVAYVIEKEGIPVGFITTWPIGEAVYIEHFATDASVRGCGVGKRALDALKKMVASPLVLEAEPEGSNAMASRRLGFYRRCGFEPHFDFDYVQPPYAPGLPSVPLVLMTFGEASVSSLAPLILKKVYGIT